MEIKRIIKENIELRSGMIFECYYNDENLTLMLIQYTQYEYLFVDLNTGNNWESCSSLKNAENVIKLYNMTYLGTFADLN